MTSSPIGVLLANVGTPAAPTPAAVRRYLAEFLADPRIVDYPAWLCKPFLHGILLRFRPRRSARLYQRIWTEHGSPLLHGMQALATRLQAQLDGGAPGRYRVSVGMRYGSPAIDAAIRAFHEQGMRRILLLPLFPQYSGTTTGSVYDAAFAALRQLPAMPELRTVSGYPQHPGYIRALADSIRAGWADGRAETLLFSFHGIPQRYARAGDPYPAQCEATAKQLAAALELEPGQWTLAYQSKFGPERWLEPATDATLSSFAGAGMQSVDVVCPGFAVDCLETVDEIGHEARRTFIESGGGAFRYLPALNAAAGHVNLLTSLVEEHTAGWH